MKIKILILLLFIQLLWLCFWIYYISNQDKDISQLQKDVMSMREDVSNTAKLDWLSDELDNTVTGLIEMTNLLNGKFQAIEDDFEILDSNIVLYKKAFKIYDDNVIIYNKTFEIYDEQINALDRKVTAIYDYLQY